MKKIIGVLVFSLLVGGSIFAQSSYEEKVKTYMEAMGVEQTYKTAVKSMLAQQQQINSEVPAEVWAELENEFMKASIDELVEMLAPVYKKHMSEADLDKIIQFYNTPVGKKLAEATPAITQESMQVGQQWGMKVGQMVADKLEKEGY